MHRYLRHPGRYAADLARRAAYFLRTGYLHTNERDNPDFPSSNQERHLRAYQFCLPLAAELDVLDVGCGCGTGSNLLARAARSVTAIDRSSMALQFARRRWKQANLRFLRMDAHTLQFAAASFDFIITNENIEHLDPLEPHVAELARVLRPGGMVFVGTPDPAKTVHKNRYHQREMTAAELQELLGHHFRAITVLPQSGFVSVGSRRVDAGQLENAWSYFVLAMNPQ